MSNRRRKEKYMGGMTSGQNQRSVDGLDGHHRGCQKCHQSDVADWCHVVTTFRAPAEIQRGYGVWAVDEGNAARTAPKWWAIEWPYQKISKSLPPAKTVKWLSMMMVGYS